MIDIGTSAVLENAGNMDAHHLALTSSDPSDIPPHNISLSEFDQHAVLAGIQGNMSFPLETPAAGKDPITRWYMNDGPWDPLTFGANDHGNPPIVSDMEGKQYVVPTRRPIVPSEFIPHSDSGYGSAGYHNRPSIANGSVCDDSFETSPDAQSVIGGSMVDAPFTVSDAASNNVMTSDALARPWPNPGPIRIEGANMKCETCDRVVKTKSELKFVLLFSPVAVCHMLRHCHNTDYKPSMAGNTTNATRSHSNAMSKAALGKPKVLALLMTWIAIEGVCIPIVTRLALATSVTTGPVGIRTRYGHEQIISKHILNESTKW